MSTEGGAARASRGPVDVLARFLERAPKARPGERCEMCAVPIDEPHSHVVDLETRNLLCTCRPCALLFVERGAGQGKFRTVPRRHLYDPGFRLSEAEWDELAIPVRIAFFFRNTSLDRVVAFYPSPAAATESTLPLEAWAGLVERNPILRRLEPDVEALLVYGPRRTRELRCFLVPIDACYELTGIVKLRWRGFDGGEEAWREIDAFFERIRAKSREIGHRDREGP